MRTMSTELKRCGQKTSQNKREYRIFGKSLFVVDPLQSHINMEEIIDSIQGSLSSKHFDHIDVVYVVYSISCTLYLVS